MTDATETRDETTPEASRPNVEATDAHASVAAHADEHADSSNAEGQDEGHDDGQDEGGEEGEATEGQAAEGQAADGSPAKKKRRRRKKKKAGAEGAAAEGAQQPAKSKKDTSHLAFGKYFDGARKFVFANGEVIAGRVASISDGAFSVDLFGKATAFVDMREPREIEALPVAAASPEAAPAEALAAEQDAAAAAEQDAAAAAEHDAAHAASEAVSAEAHAEAHAEGEHAEGDHAEGEHTSAGEVEAAQAVDLPAPAVGDIYRGRIGAVSESGHIAIVNRNVDVPAAKARIAEARTQKKRVLGLIYGFNRGGFDVLVEGIRAFAPASGMSLGGIDNPESLLGKRVEFSLPELKAGAHGIIVSRRSILERELRKRARDRVRALKVGERLTGRVLQVRDFGCFVDLGEGVEGIVHISEMSWDRGARPGDIVKVGDVVEAAVVKVPESRKERHERVGLSLKATQQDPWDANTEHLKEGRTFKGKVARVTEFGAFIEVAPAIDGLLHISEFGRDAEQALRSLKEGEELDVAIERIDRKARKISLSKLSAAEVQAIAEGKFEGEGGARAPKHGTITKMIVERVEPHGIFGQIVGVVGRKGRAYMSNGDSATDKGADMRKIFPMGKEFEVKIVGVDRDGGLKVSRKALIVDEEKRAVQDYRREASKQGFGTFGDLLRAKLGGDK